MAPRGPVCSSRVGVAGGAGDATRAEPSAPRVHFWSYPVFEAVGYGEIQRDTARYVRVQLDTVRYSRIPWICCKTARCR